MLSNHRILVVEGFLLLGADVRDALVRAGATVHVVSTVTSALTLLQRQKVTGAIIDTATDKPTQELCRMLDERDIPFMFSGFPTRHQPPSSRVAVADEAAATLANVMSLKTAA